MNQIKPRPVVAVVFACLLLAAVVAAASENRAAGSAASANATIEVESVVLRLLEEAEVPAQESGVVTSVAVREGQRVKQGELLAQIDDQVPRLAANAAKAEFEIARAKAENDVQLRFAKKSLEVSEAELRRSTESIERFPKSVSQSQLDVEKLNVQKNRLEAEQAEQERKIATLEMNAKQNELTAAQAEVTRRRIVAPFDGAIVQVYVRKGEWVEPGQKALRIVNVDRLKAEGFVPAAQATADLDGKHVRVAVESVGSASQFDGTIVFVSPEVDPITGQVRVWAEIDNRNGRLRPGQAAKMVVRQ
ncbi:MAG: efflux RND transporter periplasmic adaptor subunit [Planctomycetes bacterium]|nr:efflux RND transporter periplasmic adaptor subunit [Planctomycetota bacterium]